MGRIVRLTERDLTRIVRKVIMEQKAAKYLTDYTQIDPNVYPNLGINTSVSFKSGQVHFYTAISTKDYGIRTDRPVWYCCRSKSMMDSNSDPVALSSIRGSGLKPVNVTSLQAKLNGYCTKVNTPDASGKTLASQYNPAENC